MQSIRGIVTHIFTRPINKVHNNIIRTLLLIIVLAREKYERYFFVWRSSVTTKLKLRNVFCIFAFDC